MYTWYILSLVKHDFWVHMRWCPEMSCCVHAFPFPLTYIASFESWQDLHITKPGICIVYTMYISRIYLVYTMGLHCLDLKDEYAFLKFSGFDITLSSPMAWVHRNRIRKNTRKLHFNILCIYMVYTMYIPALGIYMVYTWYIYVVYTR